MRFFSTAATATAATAVALEGRTVCAFHALRGGIPALPSGRSSAATPAPVRFHRSPLPLRASSPWTKTLVRRRVHIAPVLCATQTSDIASTPGSAEAKGAKAGGGGGHGGMSKADKKSFVQWDMRRAAMKLHTRDQAPKEGKQENKGVAFSDWKPTRRGYLQFLVDSKVVYEALEETVASDARISEFRDTGLERSGPLANDIAWMIETYPDATAGGHGEGEGKAPSPTENALEYADFLRSTIRSSLPAFMCHYYNHYFAHTAGGRMIGRKVSESCLEGRTIEFYTWRDDVKELLDAVRIKIDGMAKGWSAEEKEQCVAETGRTFQYGGRLLQSITS